MIYDYFYDIDGDKFVLWSDNIPTLSFPIHQGIPLNVFMHTPSTMFLNSMIDKMNQDESVMIAGETGCGNTSLIADKFFLIGNLVKIDYFYIIKLFIPRKNGNRISISIESGFQLNEIYNLSIYFLKKF